MGDDPGGVVVADNPRGGSAFDGNIEVEGKVKVREGPDYYGALWFGEDANGLYRKDIV